MGIQQLKQSTHILLMVNYFIVVSIVMLSCGKKQEKISQNDKYADILVVENPLSGTKYLFDTSFHAYYTMFGMDYSIIGLNSKLYQFSEDKDFPICDLKSSEMNEPIHLFGDSLTDMYWIDDSVFYYDICKFTSIQKEIFLLHCHKMIDDAKRLESTYNSKKTFEIENIFFKNKVYLDSIMPIKYIRNIKHMNNSLVIGDSISGLFTIIYTRRNFFFADINMPYYDDELFRLYDKYIVKNSNVRDRGYPSLFNRKVMIKNKAHLFMSFFPEDTNPITCFFSQSINVCIMGPENIELTTDEQLKLHAKILSKFSIDGLY